MKMYNKDFVIGQLKLSKKQHNDERYKYLCRQFNAIYYCIELEKYTNKLQSELNKVTKQLEVQEQKRLKVIEYIKSFDIDKSFSFPLMKKWEENQVKSSIDYEFNQSLYKELLEILGEDNDRNN